MKDNTKTKDREQLELNKKRIKKKRMRAIRTVYKGLRAGHLVEVGDATMEAKDDFYLEYANYKSFSLLTDIYVYGCTIEETLPFYSLAIDQTMERRGRAVVDYACNKTKVIIGSISEYIAELKDRKEPFYIYHNGLSVLDIKWVNPNRCYYFDNLDAGVVLVVTKTKLCTHNDCLSIIKGKVPAKQFVKLGFEVPDFCIKNCKKFLI